MRSGFSVAAVCAGNLLCVVGNVTGQDAPEVASPPRRDAELIAAWGRGVLTGPIPAEPPKTPPTPVLPDECRVLDTGLDGRKRIEDFLTGVVEETPSAEADARWTPLASTSPGVWAGDFDHAWLRVASARGQVCFARLTGAEVLVVNGQPYYGDPERRGWRGVPVALHRGENAIFVGGANGGFELELWSPENRVVLGTWDVRIGPSEELSIPVFNAASRDAEDIHFHYGRAVAADAPGVPSIHEWACGGRIAPLCFGVRVGYPWALGREAPAAQVRIPLCAYSGRDVDADRRAASFDVARASAASAPELPPDAAWFARSGLTLVYATGGGGGAEEASLATARYLQQMLWYHAGVVPAVIADHDLPEVVERSKRTPQRVVLVGDAKRSLAWRHLLRFDDLRPLLPRDIAEDADREDGLRLVAPEAMPADLPIRVGLIHSRTEAGLRLACGLDPLGDVRLDAPSLAVDRDFTIRSVE